ncbi:DedA family protein [Actinacidiphila yeochonensis]|uniref:DedA family protein n=1 Tax=Actinacidiphila yeochonensis TaxID=89050 RepID=UPI00068DAB1E|nr:DedA family protein [Actinacidiphila yeochonensis]
MPLPVSELALNPLDASSLLSAFGAPGIAVVLFAETGLLVGFFLPGDSLLFTAGLLCSAGTSRSLHLSLWQVLVASVVGALVGSQTGYLLGRRGGPALLARSRSRRLREGADRAAELLDRYGHAKAVVLARFVPVVRTVLNPLAGALGVPARTFTLWSCAGGAVWAAGLVLAGYGLGSSVPNVDTYLLPVVALIVVVSLTPLAVELLRARRRAATAGPEPSGATRSDARDTWDTWDTRGETEGGRG